MKLEPEIHPLTPGRWDDFMSLFGARGACGGCWCMYFRMTRKEFSVRKGDGNRLAMKALVDSGEIPGLMAYNGTQPVAWISIGPRDHFPLLQRSRILKPVDALPVWSIVCFFVSKPYRRKGLSRFLISSAVRYAGSKGAVAVEAYPVIPRSDRSPDVFLYTGIAGTFEKAGFIEVCRRSGARPVMRYYLNQRELCRRDR